MEGEDELIQWDLLVFMIGELVKWLFPDRGRNMFPPEALDGIRWWVVRMVKQMEVGLALSSITAGKFVGTAGVLGAGEVSLCIVNCFLKQWQECRRFVASPEETAIEIFNFAVGVGDGGAKLVHA